MASVLVRDLSPKSHQALKRRAAANGRSVSAEIRAILDNAIAPPERLKLGTELAKFGKKFATELAQIDFESLRDKSPIRYPDFTSQDFDRPEFE